MPPHVDPQRPSRVPGRLDRAIGLGQGPPGRGQEPAPRLGEPDGAGGAIRDSFAEDAVWEYPGDLPLSGTWRGRDTIVDDFLGSVGTALRPGSTVALEVTSVLTAGDQVVAEWTSRATARGGAAYHNRNVGIFTVRDGKIAAVREYTDTQHAAHVLFGQS
jgi:ketosteroid isomerase-like protein